jgi:nucleoside-diphosphate-sugar epimerase
VKVLIPGGSGFLGGILTQKLVDKNVEVHIVSRSLSRTNLCGENYSIINGDLTKTEIIEGIANTYDAVVYLTGISARETLLEPEQTLEINAIAPQRLLKHLANSGLNSFVYVSTQHVEKLLDGSMNKSNGGPGLQLYAISKLAGEIALNQTTTKSSLTLRTLRLPNCFGLPNLKYGVDTDLAINDFCRQAAGNSVIKLRAPDNQVRKFCVAETVIDVIANMIAPDFFAEPYETPEKNSFSCGVLDIAKIVCTISKAVTEMTCSLIVRDEILEYDDLEILETIERIPDRFISEVERLIKLYMVR